MKKITAIAWIITMMMTLVASPAFATDWGSENVTMQVGETKTLYLPSYIISKSLKSVNFYSASYTLSPTVYPTNSRYTLTWTSSDTSVATVSSSGMVTAKSTGKANITVKTDNGKSATCLVTVSAKEVTSVSIKSSLSFDVGDSYTLTPTVTPSDAKTSYTWSSDNSGVAAVSQYGVVTAKSAGIANITVKTTNGKSATCLVTVSAKVKLSKTKAIIEKGKTLTLKATVTPSNLPDKSVTWKSSDTKIATVTSAGKVKGVKYGTATITCTSVATGAKATCQVTVGKVVINMTEFTLKKSRAVTLVATIYPTTLTDKSVTWKSSDTSIATVNAEGKVKGIKAGKATITCTSVATGLKATCKVTVLPNSEARSMIGDDDELTGIKELEGPAVVEPFDVYDLSGRKVLHQVTSLDGLPDGIYIVNGKKILKKK